MAQLTTDQRAQVLQLIESGYISPTTAPQFLENLRNAPNAHDAIRQAMDNTMGDRWARDFAGVGRTVHGVGDAVSDFGKRFQEQGALGVGGNILSSIVTTPFRAAGDVLGGNIQNPLQTTIGLASFLPVGQGVGSLARRALGKSVSRGGAWRAASGAVQLADIGTAENYLVDEIIGEGMVAGAIGRGHSGQRRPDTKPSATPPPPGTPHAPGGFDIQPTPEQIRQINAQASASQNFNVPPPPFTTWDPRLTPQTPLSPNLPALQGDRGVVPPAQPQPIRLETEPVPDPQGGFGSPPPRPAPLPPGTPNALPSPTAPQAPSLDQYRQFQEGIASLENRFQPPAPVEPEVLESPQDQEVPPLVETDRYTIDETDDGSFYVNPKSGNNFMGHHEISIIDNNGKTLYSVGVYSGFLGTFKGMSVHKSFDAARAAIDKEYDAFARQGESAETAPEPQPAPQQSVRTDDRGVVLGEDGIPLNLYHGSKNIESIKKRGFKKDKSIAPGIYFTDDLGIAATYVSGGGFVSANVIMKNPFVHTVPPDVTGTIGVSSIVKKAKQDGHDGVIIRNYNDNAAISNTTPGDSRANVYIVFEPDQIADATIGTSGQPIGTQPQPGPQQPTPEPKKTKQKTSTIQKKLNEKQRAFDNATQAGADQLFLFQLEDQIKKLQSELGQLSQEPSTEPQLPQPEQTKAGQLRAALDEKIQQFEDALDEGVDQDRLDELQIEIMGIEQSLQDEQQDTSGGGGTTFFSDPFTAAIILGKQTLENIDWNMVGDKWRTFLQNIQEMPPIRFPVSRRLTQAESKSQKEVNIRKNVATGKMVRRRGDNYTQDLFDVEFDNPFDKVIFLVGRKYQSERTVGPKSEERSQEFDTFLQTRGITREWFESVFKRLRGTIKSLSKLVKQDRIKVPNISKSTGEGRGGGGITLYSDPFTASLVEGGKLVAGTFRWFANRIKADYSIPSSPTGSVDPNIAKETIVNKGISPGMRAAYENVRRFFAAGMTDLKKMGLGDVAGEIEQKLQLDASRMENQWTQKIQPFYVQINKLANTRFARTGKSKADIKSEIHELIWNYIERGANKVTITDPEIKAIAEPFREAWRELVAESNHLFFNDLPEYLRTNYNEEFYKLDANFQPIPYSPDAIDGFTFNPETQKFVNDATGQEVVMERAFFESEGTYMPHNFPHEYWQQREKTVSGRIDGLSMSRTNPNGSVPGFEFNEDKGQYTRQRDGATFGDRTEAIDAEIAYQRQILENVKRESEMSRPDIRDRVGSLERTRDATETNYKRNLDLLPIHLMEIARRYYEIKMFGQRNPYNGELPRYEEYIARARDAVQSDREEEIKKIYDRLTPHHGFEQLGAIEYGQRQSSAALLRQMANIDVQKLKTDLPDLDIDLLTRIGLFREAQPGNHVINEADAYRHFAWFNDARNKRANSMRSVLEGMTNWHWKNPTDSEYNKFWRTMSDVTTGLTLNPFTALRNITTEMPLLASMVGPGIMGKALKQFLTDSDVRELAKMTHSGGLQSTQYFTEGTQFGSTYLKAIGYTGSEAFVRNVGTVAGRLSAKKAISDYIANPNRANTAALDYLKMDKSKIDAYIQEHGKDTNRLDQIFAEADKRTVEGVTPIGEAQKRVGTPQASNRHVDPFADEINRTGAYVSDTIFKPYNRLSQPQFLSSKNPVERTLFKFKSWIGQTMRLLRESAEKSVAQAKQGNYKPMFNLIASFTMMGIGGMATKTLFDALAGREDKEGFSALGFMDGLAAAGAMHLFSVVWEQVRYADGNTFKAYQSLLSFLSAPTVGVASQVGSQLLVGDIKGAAGEIARIAPITREAIRARGLLPQEQ